MQPDWVAIAGVWVGLVVALLVFSAILGDHWLARLGQTILVAAGLGYAAAVTWHAVIGLPFVQGLLADPRRRAVELDSQWSWRRCWCWRRSSVSSSRAKGDRLPADSGVCCAGAASCLLPCCWRRGLPSWQWAQCRGPCCHSFWRLPVPASAGTLALDVFFTGLLTLVITASALVFWGLDPQRHLAGQPSWVQRLMRAWVWFGQRAVWLAAGVHLCAPAGLAYVAADCRVRVYARDICLYGAVADHPELVAEMNGSYCTRGAIVPAIDDPSSILALGFDAASVRACLLEMVSGRCRLAAWSSTPLQPDLSLDAQAGGLLQQLGDRLHRTLWNGDEGAPFVLSDEPTSYPPLGQIAVAASPRAHVRVWVAGLTATQSLVAAEEALAGGPAQIVGPDTAQCRPASGAAGRRAWPG